MSRQAYRQASRQPYRQADSLAQSAQPNQHNTTSPTRQMGHAIGGARGERGSMRTDHEVRGSAGDHGGRSSVRGAREHGKRRSVRAG